MKNVLFGAALAASMMVPVAAFAQSAPAVVDFKAIADMPSLKDDTKKDTFDVTIGDGQVLTVLKDICQAGRTSLMVFRTDRGCEVTGNGNIINPNTKALLPRTQIMGGYMVKADGTTDAGTMTINYLAVGKVPASSASFGGTLNLKPELTSSGANALKDSILKKVKGDAKGLIDERVDTVDFNGLFIPSAGMPSDKGTTISGNAVFAYQTNSWYLKLRMSYGGKEYALEGNMPWTDTPNVPDQTEYNLTLTLPGANAGSDDALFASATGDGDLFAGADGIVGKIIMKQSRMVTVKIDGEDTPTPSYVEASGSFTGTNVPIEVVRSLATTIGLLSSTFFGA